MHLNKRILTTALLAVFASGCRSPKASSPHSLPVGHVEIQVEFKDTPNDAFSNMPGFLAKLAGENSALREGSEEGLRAVGDRHAFSGWTNDGFAIQQYKPNHPVPSPEVEEAMKERLKSFLKDNNMNPEDAQLRLRYGS